MKLGWATCVTPTMSMCRRYADHAKKVSRICLLAEVTGMRSLQLRKGSKLGTAVVGILVLAGCRMAAGGPAKQADEFVPAGNAAGTTGSNERGTTPAAGGSPAQSDKVEPTPQAEPSKAPVAAPPHTRVDSGLEQADASVAPEAALGDWSAGDYPADLLAEYFDIEGVPGQRGLVRQYKVHVPPSYRRERAMPLVFCLHGLGQDPNMFCVSGAQLDREADRSGFILVMPLGYENSWNGGTCCGTARDEKLDDVALFRAIFAEVAKHLNVDRDRVYAIGLSNGGYMSYRLACEAADLITGIGVTAAAVGVNALTDKASGDAALLSWSSDFMDCSPSRPVSIFDIHGTADELIPFSLQAKSLSLMASKYGCGGDTVPATTPKSGGDTACVTYANCPSGIELTSCSVTGGGHCWFGSEDCGTGAGFIGLAFVGANSDTLNNNEAIAQFFARTHPR